VWVDEEERAGGGVRRGMKRREQGDPARGKE